MVQLTPPHLVPPMISPMLRAALSLVAVLAAVSTSAAQITTVPGSGCPTMPAIAVTGTAKIGTGVSCSCPPSIDRMQVMIGLPASRFVFNKPFMCLDMCNLDMTILELLPLPSLRFTIPNDPSLVGQAAIVQCLQSSLNRPCLLLTGASQIKVTL